MAKAPVRKTRAEDTAEAKRTLPAKQEAAAEQFKNADEEVAAETRIRMAALGGL